MLSCIHFIFIDCDMSEKHNTSIFLMYSLWYKKQTYEPVFILAMWCQSFSSMKLQIIEQLQPAVMKYSYLATL